MTSLALIKQAVFTKFEGDPHQRCQKQKPTTAKKPEKDWHYLQVIKKRRGSKLVSVKAKVIYGDPEEVKRLLGEHTAYIERTNLTSRQMNGRLVRKTLSFSKELKFLKATTALEDALYLRHYE